MPKNVAVALQLGNRHRLVHFEEHDRQSLDCFEQTVSRNKDIGSSTSEDSEENEKHGRENLSHFRKYLSYREQTVGRNTGIKGTGSEGSDRNQEHVIGNWRDEDLCNVVAENLAGYGRQNQ